MKKRLGEYHSNHVDLLRFMDSAQMLNILEALKDGPKRNVDIIHYLKEKKNVDIRRSNVSRLAGDAMRGYETPLIDFDATKTSDGRVEKRFKLTSNGLFVLDMASKLKPRLKRKGMNGRKL